MPQTTYNLLPPPRWLFTDLTGLVLSNGTMFTYEDLNRTVPKAVYLDPAGMNPWTNPIVFALNGMPNGAFYFASDSNYYLAVFDQNNVPQFTVGQFPGSQGTSVSGASFIANYIRNAQFTYWTNSTTYPGIGYSLNSTDFIADDWLFIRSNLNATINISQQIFNLGQTDVPFNPVGYLDYECTASGAGAETSKRIYQQLQSVQTLSGEQVTFAFWGRSSTSSTVILNIYQNFGTGGSPSATVITPVVIANLTPSWEQYTGTIVIPTVVGMSLGTNGDDNTQLSFDLPLNQVASINLCNVQGQPGTLLSGFPYMTPDDQAKQIDNLSYGIPKTGDFKFTLRVAADPGWVVCNNSTIGNQFSNSSYAGLYTKALFELLWNNVSNSYAVLFNSSGTPISRGSTAEADFNANNRITLTATLGRVLGQFNGTYPMGSPFGEENHTLITSEIPSITPTAVSTVIDPTHAHQSEAFTAGTASQNGFVRGAPPDIGPISTTAVATGITVSTAISSFGGGGAHNTIQPTSFVNCMIKL